jgi:glycosyltransferase involved in cell wall biosynthesis
LQRNLSRPHAPYAPYSPYAGSSLTAFRSEFCRRARRAVRGFDVIHAHDWVTFDAAHELASDQGRPWVAHFHSTEHERRFDPDSAIDEIEHRAVRHASAVVSPSEVTRSVILRDHGPCEVYIVPNCLSSPTSRLERRGTYETSLSVYAGRLAWQKGPDRFAQLATRVHNSHRRAPFVAFGTGDFTSGIVGSRHIVFAGALAWASRCNAFRDASILVVPSRHEPFGMSILEGMQHGVAVVYPHSAGAAEVLRTGIKVEPSDVDAGVEHVTRLLDDPSHWTAVVEEQWHEIRGYAMRSYETRLSDLWESLR